MRHSLFTDPVPVTFRCNRVTRDRLEELSHRRGMPAGRLLETLLEIADTPVGTPADGLPLAAGEPRIDVGDPSKAGVDATTPTERMIYQ
jgi:hypothetical protein